MDIDWNELIEHLFLDEAPVTIRERPATLFADGKTGTRIEIWELRPPRGREERCGGSAIR